MAYRQSLRRQPASLTGVVKPPRDDPARIYYYRPSTISAPPKGQAPSSKSPIPPRREVLSHQLEPLPRRIRVLFSVKSCTPHPPPIFLSHEKSSQPRPLRSKQTKLLSVRPLPDWLCISGISTPLQAVVALPGSHKITLVAQQVWPGLRQ